MIIKRYFGPVLLFLLLAGCAGLSNTERPSNSIGEGDGKEQEGPIPLLREYHIPVGLEFFPAPFSWPDVAPGVGIVTREQDEAGASIRDDEKKTLTESFRIAYIEGQLRQASLDGVLGGDFVHRWPPVGPLSWVQNWRDHDSVPNTWGIPSLILAVRGIKEDGVFIVRGAILNMYGRSKGINGANGAGGYGAPLGEEFRYQDGIAQRFEYGLIQANADGKGNFIPNGIPLPEKHPPSEVGYFPGDNGTIREDFLTAWRRGINSNLPELKPDDPVRRLDFSGEEPLLADSETIHVTTLYFQSFNSGSVLFLLAQSPEAPLRTRIIGGAFLEAFLAGASTEGLAGRLLQGLSLYGLPLTDAYPVLEEGAYRDTQRFSRGWMRAPIE